MKKKIFDALKTRYANLGVSDSVLDRVAENLAKTVTGEEGIEAAVSAPEIANLLKAVQGSEDRLRTENAEAKRQLEEMRKRLADSGSSDDDSDKGKKKGKDEGDDPVLAMLKEMKKEMTEFREQRAEEDKRRRQSEMMSSLKALMKGEKYKCSNEKVLDLTLKGLEFGDKDTVESVAEAKKQEYDMNFKELYGEGYMPGFGSAYGEGDAFDFKGEVARLQAGGKIPAPNNGQKS